MKPYMQFYVSDYMNDSKVKLLSLAAQGLYLRIMCCMWMEEREPFLPYDPVLVARITGVPFDEFNEAWAEMWREGYELFTLSRDGKKFTQKRLRVEWEAAESKSKVRSEAQAKGVENRRKRKMEGKNLEKSSKNPIFSAKNDDFDECCQSTDTNGEFTKHDFCNLQNTLQKITISESESESEKDKKTPPIHPPLGGECEFYDPFDLGDSEPEPETPVVEIQPKAAKKAKKIKGAKDKSAQSPYDFTPEFLRFWEAYPPRKCSKVKAFRAWRECLSGEKRSSAALPESLITAARSYADYCRAQGREEQYILHAATFLGPDEPWRSYSEQRDSSGRRLRDVDINDFRHPDGEIDMLGYERARHWLDAEGNPLPEGAG